MQAEHLLDLCGVEPLQNIADRGVGRRPAPAEPEGLLEPSQVDLDERMDGTVGVGPRQGRQNREQNHVGQLIELAFGATRVLDLGQKRQQVSKRIDHGNRPPLRLPAIDSEKSRDSNPKSFHQPYFPSQCGISDSPQSK